MDNCSMRFWLLLAPFCLGLLAQSAQDVDVEPGTLLVAGRKLHDPNFAQRVVLIVADGEDGTLGIVLNRQADATVEHAFPDWKEAKGRTEHVFIGGPIENAVLTLARSNISTPNGFRVLDGVQIVPGRTALQKILAGSGAPGSYRVYVGYAGWGPEQLDEEIEAGAWQVFPGNRNIVFDAEPDTLWSRLIARAETQIARLQLLHCPMC